MKHSAWRFVPVILMIGLVIVSEISLSLPTAEAYALGFSGAAPAVTTGTVTGYLNNVQRVMNGTSALPAAPSWLSSFLNGVGQWFSSFAAQSKQPPSMSNLPAGMNNSIFNVTSAAWNFILPFDTWLYGIAHVHVIVIFNFVFGVANWILGYAVTAVSWLNTTFHSAAGK